jgi:hypothetical protein
VTAFGQAGKETLWVLQNPPFGSIATLAGFPELPSAFPVSGPLQIDVRLSERIVGVAGGFPSRFLRLTQKGDQVDAALYLWWFGQLGPYEPCLTTATLHRAARGFGCLRVAASVRASRLAISST